MTLNSQRSLAIAIAEDDRSTRRLLQSILEDQLGHRVVFQADNGQALVDASRTLDMDLIVIDLDMPILDGLEAAEQITEFKKVPVILLSGHPDLNHMVAESEPIAICLTKPVSVDQLRRAIDTLFR